MTDIIDSEDAHYTKESERLASFDKTYTINKKKCSWRYKVLHPEDLALSGFFFRPSEDEEGNLQSDSVKCVYCNRITGGLKSCRSKTKDRLETMENVLSLHILEDEKLCLLSYLKLKILRDEKLNRGLSDWQNDKYFKQPFSREFYEICTKTFTHNMASSPLNYNLIDNAVRAGLIKYDPSYTSYKPMLPNYSDLSKNHLLMFCVYCKTLLPISIDKQSEALKPIIVDHFNKCNKKCYFFKILKTLQPDTEFTEHFLSNFSFDYQLQSSTNNGHKEVNNDSPNDLSDADEPKDNPSSNDSVIHHSGLFEKSNEHLVDQTINTRSNDTTKQDVFRGRSNNKKLRFRDDSTHSPSVSPTRGKRRKLLQSSPRRLSSDAPSLDGREFSASSEEQDAKQVTIKIREHVERKKNEIQRSNKLLDSDEDSDMFSFSAHGHSTFEIPPQSTQSNIPPSISPEKQPLETENRNESKYLRERPLLDKTLSNTIFTENKILHAPKTPNNAGESSPEFVTALSAVKPAHGTPSQKEDALSSDAGTPQYDDSPSSSLSQNKNASDSSGTSIHRSSGYPDDLADISIFDTKAANSSIINDKHDSSKRNAGIHESSNSKHEPDISDIALSMSSESLSSDDSVSSTPVASPQHNLKSSVGSIQKTANRRLRHL